MIGPTVLTPLESRTQAVDLGAPAALEGQGQVEPLRMTSND
jgi:hypothetical protein